ncbi:MAG: hypothetical protein LCH89_00255 [Proteobacteria bacterium]|nr:hypothetical protein [Pseudomonadota bacterium]
MKKLLLLAALVAVFQVPVHAKTPVPEGLIPKIVPAKPADSVAEGCFLVVRLLEHKQRSATLSDAMGAGTCQGYIRAARDLEFDHGCEMTQIGSITDPYRLFGAAIIDHRIKRQMSYLDVAREVVRELNGCPPLEKM